MFSLLALSMALSAAVAAPPTATQSNAPLAVEPAPLILMSHGIPLQMQEERQARAQMYDAMEIRLDSDICYKIRAYIFSQGSHPKLLRETTCGPKAPAAKQIDGFKPKLVPLDVKDAQAP